MKPAVAIPALILTIASTLDARQQPSSEPQTQSQVFRTITNLVPLNVTVVDAGRQFVKGLTAADFAVFEDGVRQEVQFFEPTDAPLDLMILLDASSSMSDKMDVVHEAAVGFLKTLRPGDRGAVAAFADGLNIIEPLTSDVQALERAVRLTSARGATALYNALYIALKQFSRVAEQQGDVRRQAITVLSDGDDTSSLVTFDDLLALARQTGVSIYPIALQSKYAVYRLAATGQRRFY